MPDHPGAKRSHNLNDHLYGVDLAHTHEGDEDADHDHDDPESDGPLEDNPIWIQDHVSLAVPGPLGFPTEKEDDGLLYLDVVNSVPGSNVDFQFPNAIAAKIMSTQVSSIGDSVDPPLDSDAAGSIT